MFIVLNVIRLGMFFEDWIVGRNIVVSGELVNFFYIWIKILFVRFWIRIFVIFLVYEEMFIVLLSYVGVNGKGFGFKDYLKFFYGIIL